MQGSELLAQAQSHKEHYERLKEVQIEDENSGNADLRNIIAGRCSLRRDCWEVGKRYALLGEAETAIGWFRRGTEHSLKAVETCIDNWEEISAENQMHTPVYAVDVLYSAALTQDEILMTDATTVVEDIKSSHPEMYPSQAGAYHMMSTISGIITNRDKPQQRQVIANLEKTDKQQITDGWAAVATAILEDDLSLAKQGILQMLFSHEESFGTDGEEMDGKELMAFPATVAYILCHRSGLAVPVGSQYIPDIYVENPE